MAGMKEVEGESRSRLLKLVSAVCSQTKAGINR